MAIVQADEVDGILVLTIQADHLDAANCRDFRESAREAMKAAGRVVLDAGSVRFVDSAGLGSILSLLRQLEERGGSLAIARVSPSVQQVFDLVQLPRIIQMYATTQDAVRAYRV